MLGVTEDWYRQGGPTDLLMLLGEVHEEDWERIRRRNGRGRGSNLVLDRRNRISIHTVNSSFFSTSICIILSKSTVIVQGHLRTP